MSVSVESVSFDEYDRLFWLTKIWTKGLKQMSIEISPFPPGETKVIDNLTCRQQANRHWSIKLPTITSEKERRMRGGEWMQLIETDVTICFISQNDSRSLGLRVATVARHSGLVKQTKHWCVCCVCVIVILLRVQFAFQIAEKLLISLTDR